LRQGFAGWLLGGGKPLCAGFWRSSQDGGDEQMFGAKQQVPYMPSEYMNGDPARLPCQPAYQQQPQFGVECSIRQLTALLSRNAAGVGEQSTRSIWSSNKTSAISSHGKTDNSQVIFVFLVRPERLRVSNSQHCF
jgi:hypothetical protein